MVCARDEPFFEVGMNHACRLRGQGVTLDGPGAHFLGADGEVGDQIKQFVAFPDHAAEAGFRQA